MFNEKIFLNEQQISKVFCLIDFILTNFTTFEDNDEINIISSLINMVQLEKDFIFQISLLNYESLACFAIKIESIDVTSKIIEFFSEIISIEIKEKGNLEKLWNKIFTYFTFKKYKKLCMCYINNEKTTFHLLNLFFYISNYMKN